MEGFREPQGVEKGVGQMEILAVGVFIFAGLVCVIGLIKTAIDFDRMFFGD